MVFTTKDIDKVLSYKTWSNDKKQDRLLEMDCSMHCHLGTDSSKKDKEEVKKTSRRIYLAIKTIEDNNDIKVILNTYFLIFNCEKIPFRCFHLIVNLP